MTKNDRRIIKELAKNFVYSSGTAIPLRLTSRLATRRPNLPDPFKQELEHTLKEFGIKLLKKLAAHETS